MAADSFLDLPPELRNYIYDLAFTTPSKVDFLDACPPNKALTMTSKQIHMETRGLYKAAYRAFWSETEFVIDMIGDNPSPASDYSGGSEIHHVDTGLKTSVCSKVLDMRDEDLEHVSRVQVRGISDNRSRRLGGDGDGVRHRGHPTRPNEDLALRKAIYVPPERAEDLRREGLTLGSYATRLARLKVVFVGELAPDEVERARKTIGRQGLTKTELFIVLWHVHQDDNLLST